MTLLHIHSFAADDDDDDGNGRSGLLLFADHQPCGC